MPPAIKIESLSKAYQLGDFGTGTLSRDMERYWARFRGRDDPFLKIGEINDRTGNSDMVWSLKDLSLEIEQGDAVGIIGRNGAGKSTLLKILSRVTAPTRGAVKIKGRIASLLEVGTGFHPELTGRENIFLNGAILGMRKAEIKKKFDEIVNFAGIERYIDTPVKRYSSGMYVRLAFAVAAHLESEILIIDEVLAVGDAEFQKKCLGKMNAISKGEGRTVLFVSHNMAATETLCKKGIVLNDGRLHDEGPMSQCISSYLSLESKDIKDTYIGSNFIRSVRISAVHDPGKYASNLTLDVDFESPSSLKNPVLGLMIKDKFDNGLLTINNRHYKGYESIGRNKAQGTISLTLPDLPLLPGNYKIDVFLGDQLVDLEVVREAVIWKVPEREGLQTAFSLDYMLNKFYVPGAKWKFEK
ncbi:MAG: hypothetical protein JWR38_5267 [Mucilaginibacter sp.]|nr:hypothetical protein [Mucilaginibacter sp.]